MAEEIIVHLLWADDLILASDLPHGLQNQLDGLFKLKTKIMIFGKLDEIRFYFNKELDMVEECKYLGVILNSTKTSNGNIFKNVALHS